MKVGTKVIVKAKGIESVIVALDGHSFKIKPEDHKKTKYCCNSYFKTELKEIK